MFDNTTRLVGEVIHAEFNVQSRHAATPQRPTMPISPQLEEDLALDAQVRLWVERTYQTVHAPQHAETTADYQS